jgi:iron complex outermembrane receptor protein
MRMQSLLFVSTCLVSVAAPAFALDDVKADEIVVTASPLERAENETIIGVSVITKEELQNRLENSIGETLRYEPGISSTFFGPGASRPIIRGLGGDRISVLDGGIGSIDASQTSPDHAVSIEPAMAEKIEIVRGAATLLYGSSAAGGVVNVFSGRIPRAVPEGGADGAIRIGKSTVDDGTEAAGGFDINLGKAGKGNFVFHGEGFFRDAEDYDIPGFAESQALRDSEPPPPPGEPDEEEAFGTVENSALQTKGGSAGLSYVFENGFFGFSATGLDTNYGVPGGHEEEEDPMMMGGEEEEEGGVTIDLRQRRLDFDSEINGDFLLFNRAKLRVGYADYTHTEVEPSGEAGTVFSNEGVEGRFELIDKPVDVGPGELNGAVGFQWRLRDYSAIGEEAFVPPTQSSQYGVFALKELSLGALRFELGGRYETTHHEAPDLAITRDFDAFSVSGGVGVTPAEGFFLGVTGFRTERAPSVEELFSNGPHLATGAFEVGDPNLGIETARGVEATAKYGNDRFSFALNGFYTSYNDFIYEAETGLEEDGLPVFQFVAADATFKGFEVVTEAELFKWSGFDFHADASVDYVRATVDAANENLPRIPPLSGLFGVEANSELFDVRFEAEYAAEQDRIADFELPTEDYLMLHAFLTVRPIEGKGLAIRVAAQNLNNEEARIHSSFLKDVAPLPGRNVRVSLTGTF